MDFKDLFIYIENPHNSPQFKHMALLSAIHAVMTSQDIEKHYDAINRIVNESLKLVNISVKPVPTNEDIRELLAVEGNVKFVSSFLLCHRTQIGHQPVLRYDCYPRPRRPL